MISTLSADMHVRTICKRSLILLFWLGVWWGVSAWVGKELLFPAPPLVFARLWQLLQEISFWKIILLSVFRIFTGIFCSVFIGCALAALTSRFSLLDALLSPVLTVIKSTPVVSFILLMLLWIGRDTVPAVIAGMMVLPIIWSNLCAGVRNRDPDLLEMATVYRLSPFTRFRRITLPSVLPYFLSAIQSAIGIGWKAGIAAEVLTVPKDSIGKMIYESKLLFETTDLFAWTLASILLSLLIEQGLTKGLMKMNRNPVQEGGGA